MNEELRVIILAAGKGTRMNSDLPKVLHKLNGKPLLDYVLDESELLNPREVLLVVGFQKEHVISHTKNRINLKYAAQIEQLGTGHAVLQTEELLKNKKGHILILYGDVPNIKASTLRPIIDDHVVNDRDLTLITAEIDNPTGYGRIIRDKNDRLLKIVEEKDCNDNEKKIKEWNPGIYIFKIPKVFEILNNIKANNASKEYYLTDIVEYASNEHRSVKTVAPSLRFEAKGVNSKKQLAELERDYQLEYAYRLMEAGTTISDPKRIDVRGTLTCGADVSIDVGCIFEGDVTLGKNITIESHVIIRNSIIKDNSTIRAFSHIDGAAIGSLNEIGPYARIRPGTESQTRAKIGNFVEIKASTLDVDAKANHLSYIGDAKIGASVNVGAGTITCNYDGANKHQTIIEDNVFIGSDTQLVAPVTVGAGSTIAAGSTVTKDVPPGGLALSRTKQTFIADWKRPTKTTK